MTLQDYERAREQGDLSQKTVADICTRAVLSVKPDDPVSKAFQLMAGRDLGRIPVVASNNPAQVVGILRRRDIAKAYEIALQRKIEGQLQAEQLRLTATSNAHVIELRVNAHSPADNHAIRELAWPKGSLVATIRRNRQTIVPQGDTTLQSGDILTIVTAPECERDLARIVANDGPHN